MSASSRDPRDGDAQQRSLVAAQPCANSASLVSENPTGPLDIQRASASASGHANSGGGAAPNQGSKDGNDFLQVFDDFKFDETVSATFYGRSRMPLLFIVFHVIVALLAILVARLLAYVVEYIDKHPWAYVPAYLGSWAVLAGFLCLFDYWLPSLRTSWRTRACPLCSATVIFVRNSFEQTELVNVRTLAIENTLTLSSAKFQRYIKDGIIRYFEYKCNRFIFDYELGEFAPAHVLVAQCLPRASENTVGLESGLACLYATLIGNNAIEIERRGVLDIFLNEVLHPFNVFQIVSFVIWCCENYFWYALVLFIISFASICFTVYETRVNMDKMSKMTRFVCVVSVLRNGQFSELDSVSLVPGDVIVLDDRIDVIPCDGVLVNGDAVVDEAMLSGETVPISKTDIHDDAYTHMLHSGLDDARFVLYAGTKLLRSRSRHGRACMMLVTRTGFFTAKGSLVQSILFPRPNTFSFYRDSMIFIAIMSAIAVVGFVLAVINFLRLNIRAFVIFQRAADVITVVVPPALPATMAIGTAFAIRRLEKNKIFCISSSRINVASNIDIMCFDKTGTLTEDGLELWGVIPVVGSVPVSASLNSVHSEKTLQESHGNSMSDAQTDLAHEELIGAVDGLRPVVSQQSWHSQTENTCIQASATASPETLGISTALPAIGAAAIAGTLDMHPADDKEQASQTVSLAEPLESVDGIVALRSEPAAHFVQLMASCHALCRINGRLLGDTLDLQMLKFTGWNMEEPAHVDETLVPTIVSPPCVAFGLSELSVLRQFDFVSRLRRMSVIVRKMNSGEDSAFVAYCKGSPETIHDICDPASLPDNYHSLLAHYASRGYRVIGCAYKNVQRISWLRLQKLARDDVEKDMTFLGFMIFENRMKPVTQDVLSELHDALITSLMATGDNILTAVSVARASGLVDKSAHVFYPEATPPGSMKVCDVQWRSFDDSNEAVFDALRLVPVVSGGRDASIDSPPVVLAITGEFFDWVVECTGTLYSEGEERDKQVCDCQSQDTASSDGEWKTGYARCPHDALRQCDMDAYLGNLLSKCKIYARMSPQQKMLLVELLQKRKNTVGFCGDGANDCGALKAADVGISLSQAEASVAAPFTSKVQDISCVPQLLKEGRCSLVTSFGCFKYMTLYSMIQFVTLIFLYSFNSTLSDFQFIYVDLVVIVPLGVLMSYYAPATRLSKKRPGAKLISPPMLASILGHILLQTAFQCILYFVICADIIKSLGDDFVKLDNDESCQSPVTTLFFTNSAYMYIMTAFIFCRGAPYRQAVYVPFVCWVALTLLGTAIVQFYCPEWLKDLLELVPSDSASQWKVFGAAFVYFACALLLEYAVAPSVARLWTRLFSGEDGQRTPSKSVAPGKAKA